MKNIAIGLGLITIGMIAGIWFSGGFAVEEVMTGADHVTPEIIQEMESPRELMRYWDLKTVFLLFISVSLLIFIILWYAGYIKFEQDADVRSLRSARKHGGVTRASKEGSGEAAAIRKEKKWKNDLKDWENRLKQ